MNKNKAMSMSLRYLGYKMRTQKEIREYLLRKNFSEEDISDTLEKLIEYKYINDEEFAEFWIKDRYNFFNQGPYRIKNALMQKGIEKNLIEEKISAFFDEDKEILKIKQLYFKKNSLNRKLTEKEINSICNFILRKGFSGNLIQKIVFQLQKESKNDES